MLIYRLDEAMFCDNRGLHPAGRLHAQPGANVRSILWPHVDPAAGNRFRSGREHGWIQSIAAGGADALRRAARPTAAERNIAFTRSHDAGDKHAGAD
jgi:hypothetical protein